MRSQQMKDLEEAKQQSFFLECLFCKKVKQNKDKTKEPLSLYINKHTEESIESETTNKGGFAVLGIPDMTAVETQYQKTC